MELMVPPLISLCKGSYFSWHSQSSGLDVFMTQLDVNVNFPCILTSPSCTLLHSDLLLVFIFSLPFGFMA